MESIYNKKLGWIGDIKLDEVISVNCPNCNYHVGLYRKRDIGKGMNFKCIRSIKSRDHFPNNPKTRLPCFAEWSIAPTIETYNKELEAYELLERGADLIDKALKILPHKII